MSLITPANYCQIDFLQSTHIITIINIRWGLGWGQVTIYLDNEVEAKMRSSAKSMHLSQSKWIASLIERKVNEEWSESAKNLAGAWSDFPTLE